MNCQYCRKPFQRTRPDANREIYCSLLCRLKSGLKATESGCLEWQRAIFKAGYGAINIGGKIKYAHRVSYELHNGPIPDGMLVMHLCDNRRCVNPSHLAVGTDSDNNRDMWAKQRAHWHRWSESERKEWLSKILDGQKRSPSHRAFAGASKGAT